MDRDGDEAGGRVGDVKGAGSSLNRFRAPHVDLEGF